MAHLSSGYMTPQLPRDGYGVCLIGEALGADEAEAGIPFCGKAGFRLTRLIEWAGLDRSRFGILNACFCRPPGNVLEGTPYEAPAIAHCRANHWGHLLSQFNVLVPLGNVATNALLGRKGILSMRGYVYSRDGQHIIPSVHPSFIARGNAKYSPAFINDIQKAVELARSGLPIHPLDFTLDPTPMVALQWAKHWLTSAPRPIRIAFDIETPYKGDDESEANDDDDQTYHILRIGFSLGPRSGLSIPWSGEYMAAIKLLLDNPYEKVAWNVGFDAPRVRANGVRIGGIIHDGMVAWHILHSDLPKGLGFVATFTCPWQSEWKSLSGSRPAFYNCSDACIEWESYHAIEAELKALSMWHVYERDVLRIDPILAHMSEKGMPVDHEVRMDRALTLAHEQVKLKAQMDSAVPIIARRHSPKLGYVRAPAVTPDMVEITVDIPVTRCDRCKMGSPTAPHFRTLKRPTAKRPQNPCAGAGKVTQIESISRWASLDPFTPSREQMIRYHQVMKRPIPMKRDKKTHEMRPSFDESALKKLSMKYPKDQLYAAILGWRELDKLSGVYLGKIEGLNG